MHIVVTIGVHERRRRATRKSYTLPRAAILATREIRPSDLAIECSIDVFNRTYDYVLKLQRVTMLFET